MNFIEAIAAQNKDLPTVMPLDFFSYLLGKSQASPTKTITGVPPLTFVSDGSSLVDWSISGAAGGVGDRTKNIVSYYGISNVSSDGVTFSVDARTGEITVTGAGTNTEQIQFRSNNFTASETGNYYFTGYYGDTTGINAYVWDVDNAYRAQDWDGNLSQLVNANNRQSQIKIIGGNRYRVNIRVQPNFLSAKDIFIPMIRKADENDAFEPYGFKIPIVCGGETTNIFIGENPLGADDTITKTSTGVDIPTVNGSNTLTVDTTVQPSEMTITYHK